MASLEGVLSDSSGGYKPEIDGLRALAVLCVMLFHLGVPGFSGGFVGVDVFFVISGFLITRLIYVQADRGSFSFSNFYVRRVRRILPALLVTLAATLVAGALILPAARLEQLLRSVIYAALGASNVLFWWESGYFAQDAIDVPLLHTWTLGVEEQFYLIWPATLLVLTWLRNKWRLLAALVVIGALSLCAAEYAIDRDAAAAFFLMPFRIAEFVIGAVLVWTRDRLSASNARSEVCCVVGLGLIAAAVFYYTPETRFPGVSAMLPCLGAALVIIGGSARYSGYALRNRPAVWIGRISYSLYLVHWPLLSLYFQWRLQPLLPIEKAGIAIISVMLAAVMFRFVEQPFRYGRPAARPSRVFGVAAASVVFLVLVSGASLFHESATAGPTFDTATVKALKEKRFVIRQEVCKLKGWDKCDDLIPGGPNILVIGDSEAIDAYNAFHLAVPQANLVLSSLAGCPPYDRMDDLLPPNHPDRAKCIETNLKRFTASFLSPFDLIAVSVVFGWYKPEHLERFLAYAKSVNPAAPLLVFGNYRTLNTDCWEVAARFGVRACEDPKFIESDFSYEEGLADVSQRHGARFVSARPCGNHRSPLLRGWSGPCLTIRRQEIVA